MYYLRSIRDTFHPNSVAFNGGLWEHVGKRNWTVIVTGHCNINSSQLFKEQKATEKVRPLTARKPSNNTKGRHTSKKSKTSEIFIKIGNKYTHMHDKAT